MSNNIKWALAAASVPIVAYILVKITGDPAIGFTVWGSAFIFGAVLLFKSMWDADEKRFRDLYGDDE